MHTIVNKIDIGVALMELVVWWGKQEDLQTVNAFDIYIGKGI